MADLEIGGRITLTIEGKKKKATITEKGVEKDYEWIAVKVDGEDGKIVCIVQQMRGGGYRLRYGGKRVVTFRRL